MGGKQVFFEDINVGDSMPNLVKEPITETQLVMYAGASGVNFRAVTKPKDVITVKGTVSNKYTKEGINCIDIDLVSENQRGETVIAGNATAALPSKS